MSRVWTLGGVFVLRHAGMPFEWIECLAAPADLLASADRVLAAERAPEGDRHAAAQRDYLARFAAAEKQASRQLRSTLDDPGVREAIFLSNPDVYRNMLLPYLDGERPLNARWRRVRRQLYTYLQRFCAKNETVSFFGPMAYGNAVPGNGVRLHTGRTVRRQVSLAHWATQALAGAVAADRRLRADLPFRATGVPWPEHSADIRDTLGETGVSLRRLCRATGADARLAAQRLRSLVRLGCLEFGIAPPAGEPRPLRFLLKELARLPAAPARAEWALRLSTIDTLLRAMGRAPLDERVELVRALQDAFTAATGQPARRGSGAIYADRAVYYEECSSPFELEIGDDVLRRWARRLTVALEAGAAHGAAAQRAAVGLVSTVLGSTRLDLVEYGEKLRDAIPATGSRFAADHVPTYPAHRARECLAELAGEAGWLPGDRYALIDLCPATGDVGLLADAPLVLSRTHHHLLTDGWLATMHDDREEFARAAREWVAGQPTLAELDVGRRNKGYYRFPGRRIPLRAPGHADATDPDVLWPREVTVVVDGAGVRCVDAAGRRVELYLSLSDYAKYPPYAAISHPQVLHAPFVDSEDTLEVLAGDAVSYQRARWRLDPAELSVAAPAARFLALRRFAARSGAGRFVFCRTDRERKPYLVDLASVLSADLVGHIAKGAGEIQAEQMRPGPDELWLRDAAGRRYTSELRVQAIGRDRAGT